jgi:hypothetical protein
MTKRGERLRPCPRCGTKIRFTWWSTMAIMRRTRVWHWVNEDGTHHRCKALGNLLCGGEPVQTAR